MASEVTNPPYIVAKSALGWAVMRLDGDRAYYEFAETTYRYDAETIVKALNTTGAPRG